MVFSSFIFLFAFLPVFLGIYYLAPAKLKSPVILAGSYVFYAWWRIDFLFLFAGVTIWNYLISKQVIKQHKSWLVVGIAGNLLVLGLFKYFNFGVDSINAVLEQSGLNTIEALRFILPIGISFHAFQSISFLMDMYRKDAQQPKNFWDFAAYNSLFPQMIAGPVVRYKELADQFTQREHSLDLFSRGAYRFMQGFAKKVLIADTVAVLVDACFALDNPSMGDAWLGAMAYTVQLYFDFTGYSDMAIGLALMMGFKFPENFDHPYISRSITEFWRRWHITLSNWLRDYLYIPLGGNRVGKIRTLFNLFITMLLGGLWHGANWTFVLWGAWHGAWLTIEKALNIQTRPSMSGALWRVVPTFLIVVLGWVMFRSENIHQALQFYQAMFGFGEPGISEPMRWQISKMALTAMGIGLVLVFIVPVWEKKNGKIREKQTFWPQVMAMLLFLLAVTKLSYQSYSPFLYFQF